MRTRWIAIAVALLTSACGGGGGSGADTPPAVARITIAPAESILTRGDRMQMSAVLRDGAGNVLSNRTVIWSSDDAAKVAVTAAGMVRAIGTGTARVTATAEGRNATAVIRVVDAPVAVSRVALNVVSELLEEGSSLQLEATVYDSADNVLSGRAVHWATSDAGIATVTPGGLVTGLRPGIVSVTAAVEGRHAAATVRVFADHAFELLFSRADVEVPEQLYSLDINDPAAVSLPVFGPARAASHATPSPDGTRIAFVVHGRWDGTFWSSMIFVADRDGGNVARLTFTDARNVEPAWSPDGTRIAFSSQVFGQAAEIWVMNADGSNPVNLTGDQPNASKRSPSWSPRLPDGSHRIAYSLESGGASGLWTMRADGTGKLEITSDARFFDSEPSWSPDGATLVFQRTGDAIFGDLYLVASSGGAARVLLPAPLAFGQFGPVWSPDGRMIAFTSKHADGNTYQVWTVRADGTRLAQRTHDDSQHADPAWIARR